MSPGCCEAFGVTGGGGIFRLLSESVVSRNEVALDSYGRFGR
jgi:hypothetical protein